MANAHGTSAGDSIVSYVIAYWWLILIFGGGIIEWVAETFDVGVAALRRRAKIRHKRKLEQLRLELQIAQAKTASLPTPGARPLPGPCAHRRVRQVRDRNDELVAWLCTGCDTQLPHDWAVAAEDLT